MKKIRSILKKEWQLWLMILPALAYIIIFCYGPMYGIQLAFRKYDFSKGLTGGDWVGFKYFTQYFTSPMFVPTLRNTFIISFFTLVCGFPAPIFLALVINSLRQKKLKRVIQTAVYMPYFISTVVLAGMLYIFLSPTSGIFNHVRQAMGLNPIDYMSEAAAFRPIYIISNIWQTAGYSTILYIATLTGIDLSLYEAADIDGASIWQKIRYIDLPTLVPTAMMVFILDCGKLLSSNTNKVLVLQTSGNIPTSDILGVYVYTVGLGSGQFSYTSAIGLFVNVINFVMIILVNTISKKTADVGLF